MTNTEAVGTQTTLAHVAETGVQASPVSMDIESQTTSTPCGTACTQTDLSADDLRKIVTGAGQSVDRLECIYDQLQQVHDLLVNFRGPPRYWPRGHLQSEVSSTQWVIRDMIDKIDKNEEFRY